MWTTVVAASLFWVTDIHTDINTFQSWKRPMLTWSKLCRLGLKDSAACWNCWGDEGTLVHHFWMEIHCYIVNVIKVQFVFRPKFYILGDSKVLSAFPQSLEDWTMMRWWLDGKSFSGSWRMPEEAPFNDRLTQSTRLDQRRAVKPIWHRL